MLKSGKCKSFKKWCTSLVALVQITVLIITVWDGEQKVVHWNEQFGGWSEVMILEGFQLNRPVTYH